MTGELPRGGDADGFERNTGWRVGPANYTAAARTECEMQA